MDWQPVSWPRPGLRRVHRHSQVKGDSSFPRSPGVTVRTLSRGWVDSGTHVVRWDGRNDAGRAVASGVYFCRLDAAQRVATRKLLLLR